MRKTSAMPPELWIINSGLVVTSLAQLVPHCGKLDLHRALQIRIENCGECALVFAEFADDLSGKYDGQIADVKFLVFVADDFFYAALVRGIEKAPKKRNDETARAPADEVADFFADVVFVQRADDIAAGIDALFDADDHVAGDERVGLFLNSKIAAFLDACAVNPLRATADQDHVFVAFGSDQAKAWAFFLDEAIHRDRGRVADHVDRWKKFFDLRPSAPAPSSITREKHTERS